MFYERQINKPWKLKWDELSKLYNNNDTKKVKYRKKVIFFLIEIFRKNVFIYLEKVMEKIKLILNANLIEYYVN
jgi:hypothetical protein